MKSNSLLEQLIEPLTNSLEEWIHSPEALKVARSYRHPQIEKYVKTYGTAPDTPDEAPETKIKHLRPIAPGRRFEHLVSHGLSRFLLPSEVCKGFLLHGGKTKCAFPLERGKLGEVFFQDATGNKRRLATERAEFDGLILLKSGEIVLVEICNSKYGDCCGEIETYRKMVLLKESWPSHVLPLILMVVSAETKTLPRIPGCQVIRLPRSDELVAALASGVICKGSPLKIKEKNPGVFCRFKPIDFGQCSVSVVSDFLKAISGGIDPDTFMRHHIKHLYLMKRFYVGLLSPDLTLADLSEIMLPESKSEEALDILSDGHIEGIHLTIHSEKPGRCLKPVLHCFRRSGVGKPSMEYRVSLAGIRGVSERKSRIFRQEIPTTPIRITGDQVMSAFDICGKCLLPVL